MYQQGFKFVLVGPVGSGKTTALTALSDMAPVSTEMPLSDGPMGEKTTTTVALDFSTILLDDGTPLQLFGLPGQEHFSHMRSIVMQGALGALVLLPGDDPDIAAHCAHWVDVVAGVDADHHGDDDLAVEAEVLELGDGGAGGGNRIGTHVAGVIVVAIVHGHDVDRGNVHRLWFFLRRKQSDYRLRNLFR